MAGWLGGRRPRKRTKLPLAAKLKQKFAFAERGWMGAIKERGCGARSLVRRGVARYRAVAPLRPDHQRREGLHPPPRPATDTGTST